VPGGIVITSSSVIISGINLNRCRLNLSQYLGYNDSAKLEMPIHGIWYSDN